MTAEKIQDKERAILEAAIAVFAERGFWNTPTSLISKTAGVADGTLFNYFATKDELISAVYLHIKREMALELLAGLEKHESVHDKLRHIWERTIDWGLQHPAKFNVIRQIKESFALDEATKSQSNDLFIEVAHIAHESIEAGVIRDYPEDYLSAMLDTFSVMTVQFMTLSKDKQKDYRTIGFDILWRGVTR